LAVIAGVGRRRFGQLAALSALALLAGCGTSRPLADRRTIRLGYVSPQSGPLSAFGEADGFVLEGVRRLWRDGLVIGGRAHQVEIRVRDSRSSPTRAGEAARELIIADRVDLMLAAFTPETTNPVADACERAGIPCITTAAPYQAWYLGRDPAPDPDRPRPYRWTWHFFAGLEDVNEVFADMWEQVETNQVLATLWPDDGDGRAWSRYFPGALRAQGYRIVNPGRYPAGKGGFEAEIDQFRADGVQIVTGVMPPSDFATFWREARRKRYRPRVATLGKALLFPAFVEAMGAADGLSTEVWWSPRHPFTSSLTGARASQLAEAYTGATGRQWIQPLGFAHALFEVAAAVLARAGDVGDKQGLADAIKATSMDTVVGPVDWTSSQAIFPNVSRTPLVGGQWRRGRAWPFELVIVSNPANPEIPAGGRLEPIA
jgi:branched-chain amino acid transport system substrate-binding protein